jgi:peroxiredoxin Q/BCP
MSTLEGKLAPRFELTGSDGKVYANATLKGKTAVLYFYPKDDTPGCTKEACGFRDLNADIAKTGAIVLGVSRDNGESHQQFQAKYKLPFVLLTDADGSVHRAFGAWGKKVSYGKETEGVIRSTVIIGPDGTVRKHWPTVKSAEEHPAEVLAELKQMMNL